ncbi:hypothetical protein [Brachybacterium sp. 107]|uniref:hypothetical protein n=1 Tax=Brachybacterium sp. 107 TaxID=3457736 RepID=UPI004034F559
MDVVNKASGPDAWSKNRHAVTPPAAKNAGPGGYTACDARQARTGSWGTKDVLTSSPRSWSAGGGNGGSRKLVGPPYGYLWVSFAAAALAVVLAVFTSGLVLFGIAWALAGFVGFGAAVVFVQRDALRQTEVFYLRDPRSPWIYRAAIVVSLIAVIVTAIQVALVVGRMG